MAENKMDWKRDPSWQYIGVIVTIVAIFISFLVLPSSVQGTALIGIVLACIVILFSFTKLPAVILASIFTLVGFSCWLVISGCTSRHVPFFMENFGFYTGGILYPKTNLGSSLLIMIGIFFVLMISFESYLLAKDKDYRSIMCLLCGIFVPVLLVNIPSFYLSNYVSTSLFGIGIFWPKTILGTIVTIAFFTFGPLLFVSNALHEIHSTRSLR